MNVFQCIDCQKTFATKQSLGYHTRKKVCHKPTNFVCEYCDRELSSRSSLHRHKKTCKSKPNNATTELEEMKKMMKEMQQIQYELQKKVALYEGTKDQNLNGKNTKNPTNKNTTNTNNGTININNGTINNNTFLIKFGDEDLSKLTQSELKRCYDRGLESPYELFLIVHQNPGRPEWRNVYTQNMRSEHLYVYNGEDFELVLRDEIIDKIYDDNVFFIEENLEENRDDLQNSKKRAFERWKKLNEQADYSDPIKKKILLSMYNGRKHAINAANGQHITQSSTSTANHEQITEQPVLDHHKSNDTIVEKQQTQQTQQTQPTEAAKPTKTAKAAKPTQPTKTAKPTKPAKKQEKVITRRCIVNPDALTNRQRAEMSKCKTPKHQPSDTESDEASDTVSDAASDTVSEPAEISDLDEEIQQPNVRSQQQKPDKSKVKICKAGPRRSARSRK